MITVTREIFGKEYFKDFNELFNHIMKINEKKYKNKEQEWDWNFSIFSSSQVKEFMKTMTSAHRATIFPLSTFSSIDRIEAAVKAASSKDSGLLRICKGDHKNPLYLINETHLDLDKVKELWCYYYCDAHNIKLNIEEHD